MSTKLTVRDVTARGVVVPLGRPVATRVGMFAEWPMLLVDLTTQSSGTRKPFGATPSSADLRT